MQSSGLAATSGSRLKPLMRRVVRLLDLLAQPVAGDDEPNVLAGLQSHGGDFEFASAEWCDAVQKTACGMLQEAAGKGELDLSSHEWGFSEEYCNTPERLMAGRERAVYWFMIHKGKVSGGAGSSIPDECLALPGFHVAKQWAEIAHPSGIVYDGAGFQQRMRDAHILDQALTVGGRLPPASFLAIEASKPAVPQTADGGYDMARAFPTAISAAIGDRPGRPGLHNAGAVIMKASSEVSDLPMTELGVPVLAEMNKEQRNRFYRLLGRDVQTPGYQRRWLWGADAGRLWPEWQHAHLVGKFEFGQEEWCATCAQLNVGLLEEGVADGILDLTLPENRNWGFSEEYTHVPPRLTHDKASSTSCFWFMVLDGEISGGAGGSIPDECLALPGFHVTAQWAEIVHPSGFIYGPGGQAERMRQAGVLAAALAAAGKGEPPADHAVLVRAKYAAHPHIAEQVWPHQIGVAIGDKPGRPGIHNGAALIMRRSPEMDGFPESELGVVQLGRMTLKQQGAFFALLGR